MEVIFNTAAIDPRLRYRLWQEAVCETYTNLDVKVDDPSRLEASLSIAPLGSVNMMEMNISPGILFRRSHHISRLDKDPFVLQFTRRGGGFGTDGRSTLSARLATAVLMDMTQAFDIWSDSKSTGLHLEIPRDILASRIPVGNITALSALPTCHGLGRVIQEFAFSLWSAERQLTFAQKEKLGEQLIDLLALALTTHPEDEPLSDPSIRFARLSMIKAYIEENLADPCLSLSSIARNNGISLRYLHQLFRSTGVSASEWVRQRRLQRCYAMLASPPHAQLSITEIAYRMGFSSSSHFSNLFRARFGVCPSDVRCPPNGMGPPDRGQQH